MAKKQIKAITCCEKIAEAKHEMAFCHTKEEARYAYKIACKYQGILDPSYCGSRSCEKCHIRKAYYRQLDKIAFAGEMLAKVNAE